MGYINFLLWAGKQGLKNKVLQKYLNKAWQEGTKGGKEILQSQWPKLLKKAQDFKTKFKTFDPKIVPKKPNPLGDALKAEKYKKVPTPKKLTPKTETDKVLEKIGIKDKIFIDKSPLKGPRIFDFGSNVIKFPKKPPGKADGGSVDKALPKRSRDI